MPNFVVYQAVVPLPSQRTEVSGLLQRIIVNVGYADVPESSELRSVEGVVVCERFLGLIGIAANLDVVAAVAACWPDYYAMAQAQARLREADEPAIHIPDMFDVLRIREVQLSPALQPHAVQILQNIMDNLSYGRTIFDNHVMADLPADVPKQLCQHHEEHKGVTYYVTTSHIVTAAREAFLRGRVLEIFA